MVHDMQAALIDKMWILWSSSFQLWLHIRKPWGAFANCQQHKTPWTRKSDIFEISNYSNTHTPNLRWLTSDILTWQCAMCSVGPILGILNSGLSTCSTTSFPDPRQWLWANVPNQPWGHRCKQLMQLHFAFYFSVQHSVTRDVQQ